MQGNRVYIVHERQVVVTMVSRRQGSKIIVAGFAFSSFFFLCSLRRNSVIACKLLLQECVTQNSGKMWPDLCLLLRRSQGCLNAGRRRQVTCIRLGGRKAGAGHRQLRTGQDVGS